MSNAPHSLPAFRLPTTDMARKEAGERLMRHEPAVRALLGASGHVFDAFLSAHHLLFRRGALPKAHVDAPSVARARRLVRRGVKLGLLTKEPPAASTFSATVPDAVTESAALCVSLDRLVRRLVLSGGHRHTQLLWDAACARDLLNKKTRSLHLAQNVRDRWDRTFAALFDLVRGALRLQSRERVLPTFFVDAPRRAATDDDDERVVLSHAVAPPSSRDTLVDDKEAPAEVLPPAANEDQGKRLQRTSDQTVCGRRQKKACGS